jgi:hypothetical protein
VRRASTDFEIVGADAEAAARSFDRQPGRTLYDIPHHAAAEFTAMFDAHCREQGLDATLRPFDARFPTETARGARWAVTSLSAACRWCASEGLPTDRPLPVTTTPAAGYEWREIRVGIADAPVAGTHRIGDIGVDRARFAIGDADALNSWIHEHAIDGRADVVFWGRDADEVAARIGAPRLSDEHGWVDLPVAEAVARAHELDALRSSPDGPRFAFDFSPHSHHWQVMAGVRAADHEAGRTPGQQVQAPHQVGPVPVGAVPGEEVDRPTVRPGPLRAGACRVGVQAQRGQPPFPAGPDLGDALDVRFVGPVPHGGQRPLGRLARVGDQPLVLLAYRRAATAKAEPGSTCDPPPSVSTGKMRPHGYDSFSGPGGSARCGR